MSKVNTILAFSILVCLFFFDAAAQSTTSNIVKKELTQTQVDQIIKSVAKNEGEFRQALSNYVFNRSAVVQTIGLGGQVTGEFRRDSFMTLSPTGVRFEKVLFAPISTLKDINLTVQDLEDLGGVNPFALDPAAVNLYNFTYLGTEKIDELNLYVFDVAPKVTPNPKKSKQRFFLGRIWVEVDDLQIVKSKGKGIPEDKENVYPIVETWRENVDGKYWFPAYSLSTGSDGELVFGNGFVARLKMRVKYTNYTQGKSDVKILDDVEETPAPTPTPTPKATPMPTPKATPIPATNATPKPTSTPKPITTPKPTTTPKPRSTPKKP